MATKKTEVATAANTAVAAFDSEVPEYLRNQQGAGRGSEEVAAKDMVLPRLEIVQSSSDAMKEAGLAEGTMYNSATGEDLGDLVYFVPVYFRTEYIVWKDQNKGGGFFGSFGTPEEAKDRLNEKIGEGEDEDDLEVVDTPVHYGLLVHPDGSAKPSQIVISMAKSKAKVSRKWNAMIQIAGGDRFSRVYKISTFKDKNKQNKVFFNYIVQPAGYVPEAIFREAEKTYAVFKTEGVRADHGSVVGENEGGGTERGEI